MTYRSLIGSESVLITDRRVAGTAVFEAPTIAEKDFFAAAIGNTLGNLSILQGTVAGQRFEISSDKIDLGTPSYSDSDGITMINVPFVAVPSGNGNNEITFTVR